MGTSQLILPGAQHRWRKAVRKTAWTSGWGGSFLPLLLLTWLPVGLAHQISATINVSVGLDLVFQCLVQTGSNSTAGEANWCKTIQNNTELLNKGGMEMQKCSALFVFTIVNTTCTGAVSQPEEPVITVECSFQIWSENLTVHVRWYKSAGLEAENQTNTGALKENCTNLTSPSVRATNTGICGCRVLGRRTNLTDTGNSTQRTVPTCAPEALQTDDTKKETWTGLKFLLCIIFGFAVGTLLYVPIIGFLLWRCRRKGKGKLTSRQVAERNQLSTAAPVTGTEDLTYANLKFEKKGTKSTSSDVVYTEIKPSQQKQSSGDAGAANAGMDVSPEGESK